jgi:hypothetical protein
VTDQLILMLQASTRQHSNVIVHWDVRFERAKAEDLHLVLQTIHHEVRGIAQLEKESQASCVSVVDWLVLLFTNGKVLHS